MAAFSQFIVDAFAELGCKGNPAAICILSNASALNSEQMQRIAHENNLSETAFCHPIREEGEAMFLSIRWFTPTCEVDLCGHATLATSHILFSQYYKEAKELHFESKSGELIARRESSCGEFLITMEFPRYKLYKVENENELQKVTKTILKDYTPASHFEIYKGIDYVVVFEDEADVVNFSPNFATIANLPGNQNLLITARSKSESFDFISRCFFPKEGIDEDPVTGSAHCTLAPLWSHKLDKKEFTAYQASQRGGILHLKVNPDSVLVGGICKIAEL